MDPCAWLPTFVRDDKGLGGVVYFWRKGGNHIEWRDGTIGDFLSHPAHQSDRWYIDAGQGGPPGPAVVEWRGDRWAYLGMGVR